jgi:hypothetical protein
MLQLVNNGKRGWLINNGMQCGVEKGTMKGGKEYKYKERKLKLGSWKKKKEAGVDRIPATSWTGLIIGTCVIIVMQVVMSNGGGCKPSLNPSKSRRLWRSV